MSPDPEGRIGCAEAIRRLAAYLDRELTGRERAEVDRHLEMCRSCYSRADFERRLKSHLLGVGRQPPDAAFAARLSGLVRRFAGPPRAGPPS